MGLINHTIMEQSFSLEGKVIVVTGGTGILGNSFVNAIVEAGGAVGILGRNADIANERADAINKNGGRAIALIADAMKSSVWGGGSWQHGTGWNGTAWRLQRLKRRDISAKTGTTNDSKDTWFSGFTPDLAVTVWVGFDDANRSLGRAQWHANMGQQQSAGAESGARTALPAWLSYMQNTISSLPERQSNPPVGLASVRIDVQTGLLSRRTDHSSSFEFFKAGTEPTQYTSADIQQISFDSRSEKKPEDEQEEVELF